MKRGTIFWDVWTFDSSAAMFSPFVPMFDVVDDLFWLVLAVATVDSVWFEVGGLGAGALNLWREERFASEEFDKVGVEAEIGDCALCTCGKPTPDACPDGSLDKLEPGDDMLVTETWGVTKEDADPRILGEFAGKLVAQLGPGSRGKDVADPVEELGPGSLCKLPTDDGGLRPRLNYESNELYASKDFALRKGKIERKEWTNRDGSEKRAVTWRMQCWD